MPDGEAAEDGSARVLERPTASEAAAAVSSSLDGGLVVTLVGPCHIDVAHGERGRTGRRHVLLKPDGSVVVHGGDRAAPVAAIPAVRRPDVSTADGALVIEAAEAESASTGEYRLRFERVDLLSAAPVDRSDDVAPGERPDADDGGRDRHEALRERVLADPDGVEPGFRPLATERETPAGTVDVFGRDAEGRAVVVEIKGGRAGPAAVGQLDRYVAALRRDLHADAEVRGILLAPSATGRTRRLLEERGFTFRALSADG